MTEMASVKLKKRVDAQSPGSGGLRRAPFFFFFPLLSLTPNPTRKSGRSRYKKSRDGESHSKLCLYVRHTADRPAKASKESFAHSCWCSHCFDEAMMEAKDSRDDRRMATSVTRDRCELEFGGRRRGILLGVPKIVKEDFVMGGTLFALPPPLEYTSCRSAHAIPEEPASEEAKRLVRCGMEFRSVSSLVVRSQYSLPKDVRKCVSHRQSGCSRR